MSTTVSGSISSTIGESTSTISVTVTGGTTGSISPMSLPTGSVDPSYPY